MIGLLSKVNIIDNSGGLEGKCIKIIKPKSTKSGRKQRLAKVGDVILVTITKTLPLSSTSLSNTTQKNKNLKGSIYKALIVRTKIESNKQIIYSKKPTTNYLNIQNFYNNEITQNSLFKPYNYKNKVDTGVRNKFDDNSVVLINIKNNDYTPIGTRIKGPICKSIRKRKGCTKIVSITK
ncbi:ribosomal protein L14 (mitochondrion) [Monosiga brevicollis]|uniref:Ribosomal protein L14 n=1 Tax=Monosiga brevicollis TaxID=81824 RepID=Q8HIT2_MONBE|nr:ribosomal protein L14 [Monosiga brevicollis]AAN28352.1 ribosomal protein L14 [Monosiga brevicollis]|eukprot:NP_696981.1 ribosomal protein L14 (mitochondrion) [Monosiga brevicollis ATCC 50154]